MINYKVARWYLDQRIPEMLRRYHAPVTISNKIVAYNAGISYFIPRKNKGKRIPRHTKKYIRTYKSIVKNKGQ